MGSTPVYGLPYAGPNDPPNGPGQQQALAEAVEAALSALVPNSGVQTALGYGPASGWTVVSKQYQQIGKLLYVSIRQTKDSGSGTISASSTGNITGDPVVGTISNAGQRPAFIRYDFYRAGTTGGSCAWNTDGTIQIFDAHSGSSIGPGDALVLSSVYTVP